jgi:plastocyanin
MNTKIILGIVVIILAGGIWWFFFSTNSTKTENLAAKSTSDTSSSTSSANTSSGADDSEKSQDANTITYTDSGYNPQSLTINSGETITWVNDSSATAQIGSDNHPSHNNNRELTGNEFVIELAPGESAKVQLTKTGEWGYHNHLKPSVTGTIIVE